MKNQKREGKIKPCPFCGAKAGYSEEMGIILCEGCGFYFGCTTTLEQALETWNMRVGQILTPKKKKSGVVRVKGWAYVLKTGEIADTYYKKEGVYTVPVTILIDRKYIGGKL